jgi:hypothetical protein
MSWVVSRLRSKLINLRNVFLLDHTAEVQMLKLLQAVGHQIVFSFDQLLTRVSCLFKFDWAGLVSKTRHLECLQSHVVVVSI